MELIRTSAEMKAWSDHAAGRGRKIAFVPTMGFLHDGHSSLMRLARKKADLLTVSIFVNPMQFGPAEDLDAYPRNLDRDLDLLTSLGVEAVFLPTVQEMYPEGFQTRVTVTEVTQGLCGAYRPDFFPGVCTVVLKLFLMVKPHLAVFGEKDFQQLVTIRRMVKDLNLDIDIVGGGIVRESDGLAMSSRNAYLSEEERQSALSLSRALELAREMTRAGEREAVRIVREMTALIEEHPHTRVQYAEIVDPERMTPVGRIEEGSLAALAVFVGNTRLIDNSRLSLYKM